MGTKKSNTKKKVIKKKTNVKKKVTKKSNNVNRLNDIKLMFNENEYLKPLICLVIIIIILVVGYILFINTDTGKELVSNNITEDEKRFKTEYEDLNSSNIVNVKIKDHNNVKYVDMNKLLDILKNGSGLILFGNKNDSSSRLVVNSIIYNLDNNDLYYFDIMQDGNDIRDEYILGDEGVTKKSNGVEGYSELLIILGDYLKEYQLVKDDGKLVSTGEKGLDIPLFVKVSKGEIKGAVLGVGSLSDYMNLIG